MHLSGTGFPYERGSNTYVLGHAAAYGSSLDPNGNPMLPPPNAHERRVYRESLPIPSNALSSARSIHQLLSGGGYGRVLNLARYRLRA
jgi:hypothetical protein